MLILNLIQTDFAHRLAALLAGEMTLDTPSETITPYYKHCQMLDTNITERGIFIDVEMRMNDPIDAPRMIGVLVEGRYTAYACDDIFRTSVAYQNEHKPEQSWGFSPAADLFSDIMHQAESTDRKIVAYSEHEKNIIKAIFPDQHDRIDNLYFNANMSRWFRRNHRADFQNLRDQRQGQYNTRVGLKDFLDLEYIDYEVPRFFRGFSPATAIKNLEEQLQRHGDHKSITGRRKSDFTNLYTYNEHDCRGMQALLRYRLSCTGTE